MTSSKTIDLVGIKTIFLVTVVAVPVICYIAILSYGRVAIDVTSHLRNFQIGWNSASYWQGKNSSIHIAVVICGDRIEEGLVMLKSAVIFSTSYLVFHVFTEENGRLLIKEEINSWPYTQRVRLKLVVHKIEFPNIPGCKTCTKDAWVKLFRPCAAQRLFIPDILLDVDSLIYMDTDTVFLSPIEDAWRQFSNFEPHHIFGIVPEIASWYAGRALPHCAQTGVNSGVMLMNLTRVREVKWMFKIQEYFDNYREMLQLGDQDLINIYCYFYPGVFYLMQCAWNYRAGFCSSDVFCRQAHSTGINILHANNRVFHSDQFPVLRQIYLALKEHLSNWSDLNFVVWERVKGGVNSGVMLMNLTRVREVKWMFKIQEYFDNYREMLELGDQDLINIYCYFYPGVFYLMQCAWNYRAGFCSSNVFCRQAHSTGINILHAKNRVFHSDQFPVLRQIYLALKEHNLAEHSLQDLYDDILKKTQQFTETKCGKRQQILTRHLQKYIMNFKKSIVTR